MLQGAAVAIDEYLASIGVSQIDFIKVDVEGFELEVMRGAKRTIEKLPADPLLRGQSLVFERISQNVAAGLHRGNVYVLSAHVRD